MKIFKPDSIPKNTQKRASWDLSTGWAMEIDEHIYYGFKTKEQAEAAFLPQMSIPYKRDIYYQIFQ